MFKQISKKELNTLKAPFFMRVGWGELLEEDFPYLSFHYYFYNNSFLVRVTRIGARITTAPFSISGDVVSLKGKKLDVVQFDQDVRSAFGSNAMLRVHTHHCPVSGDYTSALHDHIVLLTDPHELKNTFRKTTRHIIERPIVAGSITETSDARDIDRAYSLHRSHMRYVQAPVWTQRLFTRFVQRADVLLLVWKPRGVVEAAALFVEDGNSVYYYISAGSKRARMEHAPHHLLWYAMVKYQKMAKDKMFLSSSRPNDSLEVFKRGWRGEQYDVLTVGARETRLSKRKSPVRVLWKYIPGFLLPWLTKVVGKRLF